MVSESAHRTLLWQTMRGPTSAGATVQFIAGHSDMEPHDHLFHEIVFIAAGSAEHDSAGGARLLRAGDIVVLRPLVWHAYRRTRNCDLYNCLIDSSLMQKIVPVLKDMETASELFQRRAAIGSAGGPSVLHAGPTQMEMAIQRLRGVISEQTDQAYGWEAACAAGVLELLVQVARLARKGAAEKTFSSAEPSDAGLALHAVFDTAAYLERHFARNFSLEVLARRAHLSPPYLSRLFARRMGIGLVQYMHRIRLEEACRLLRYTDAPITRIAAQVGYDEIAYFSRCFRAQLAASPREYRARWKA